MYNMVYIVIEKGSTQPKEWKLPGTKISIYDFTVGFTARVPTSSISIVLLYFKTMKLKKR